MPKLGHNEIFTPTYTGPSKAEIEAAHIILDKEEAALELQKVNTLTRCQHCGCVHSISDLVFTQTYYYIRPHGCTGGDYWVGNEGYYSCLHPECTKKINRIFQESDLFKLKDYFNHIENRYVN